MSGREIDFETRSECDIKKEGAYRYFEHPSTVPLMASYVLNGGPVKRWRPGKPCPTRSLPSRGRRDDLSHNAGVRARAVAEEPDAPATVGRP